MSKKKGKKTKAKRNQAHGSDGKFISNPPPTTPITPLTTDDYGDGDGINPQRILFGENSFSLSNMNGGPFKEKHRLVKFTDKEAGIKINVWLNLFEVITSGTKTDFERGARLISNLAGDALNFYGEEIAPRLKDLNWLKIRSLLEQRYGQESASPLLTAFKRRFKQPESVQSYYDSKMKDMRKTELKEKSMVDLLTDGMPPHFRNHLIASSPQSPLEWLNKAKSFEESMKASARYYQQQSNNNQTGDATVAVAA